MIWFPQEFFLSEEREGFLVDSTMKAVWAAEIEVLSVIATICEKYQLQWFADWGTLLGAVRHKGFVPWDDDIDICLFREDYDLLMQVLREELPKGWKVYCCDINEHSQFWACVTNADTISVEPDRLQAFHGCPFIVGVDIFPLDYIPDDINEYNIEKELFSLLWNTVNLIKKEEEEFDADIESTLLIIEDFFKTHIDRDRDIVTQLWQLANLLTRSYGPEDGKRVACYLTYAKNNKIICESMWYDEVEFLPFETVELPVPKEYHRVLTAEYGDYSVRVQNSSDHDYPYYNKQLKILRDKIKELEENENA